MVVINEEPNVNVQPDIKAVEGFERYNAKPVSKEDPLVWWKARELLYHSIAKLAKKYLAIPASSVPSEHVFSLAGHVVNKRRAYLSSENVNMLIVLNKNFGKIEVLKYLSANLINLDA